MVAELGPNASPTLFLLSQGAPSFKKPSSTFFTMQMLLVCLFSTIVVLGFYALIQLFVGIRGHSLRALLLQLLAVLKGTRVIWVADPKLAVRLLRSSANKGDLIEAQIAMPAWAPVLSLESINGEQWRRMKPRFARLAHVLPPIDGLTAIFEVRGRELLESSTPIDALQLNSLIVSCFYEWLFEREFDHEKFAFVCQAAWEWRKEIAMKGVADRDIKKLTVDWCVEEIRRTPRLESLFGEKWADPEFYSIILQPFVLSPAINLTDIAVSVGGWAKVTPETQSITPEVLQQCIFMAHPFPIVERYFPEGNAECGIPPNSQVLIALDEMEADSFAVGHELIFGAGPRACAGRHIAMKAMAGLFTDRFVRSTLFRPMENHKYSGRHNDGKETVMELLYQVKVAVHILVTAAVDRCMDL
ncbi:hypothetical protein BBJ28_00020429 [Nothophytophthora sp. Chile5]|nr:hypothetical protein BBJ28_00020429 [Nothophytophthora sp. Chile5]